MQNVWKNGVSPRLISEVVYKDELSWMQFREETISKGYMIRDNVIHTLLFMDSDELMNGRDLYLTNSHIVQENWERTEIASYVTSQTKRLKAERLDVVVEQFGNWLNELRGREEEQSDSYDNNREETESETREVERICEDAITV